jgi:hypothetical protein
MAPPRESALPSLWSRVYYAVSAPINMLHCFGRSLSLCVTYASESLWRDKVMRYLAPRIAAIGMLSLYLPLSPAEVLDSSCAEGYDFGVVTNIVSARASISAAFLALKLERKEVHGAS